jgi:hypothetical protein
MPILKNFTAKDPPVMFFWSDWTGGTLTFLRHLKVCYMDLLKAQFNNGPLALNDIIWKFN